MADMDDERDARAAIMAARLVGAVAVALGTTDPHDPVLLRMVEVIGETTTCGGCRGLGAHQRYCIHHPDYHPWRRHADMAENIGDSIGSNDPGLANAAYSLAGRIRVAIDG